MSGAYYNENNDFAAAWLRELIKGKFIAEGDVDERSIKEVQPQDLKDYAQCHFFAGIGVWSYALRRAGWPDDRKVWTGSCPCQPFSAAGKKGGFKDDRHLWPDWFRLIRECRPDTVFGEQVASKDGLDWFDLVSTDLEGAAYTVGAADLCAAGVGAPHIRQRLYFVADSQYTKWGTINVDRENGRNGSDVGRSKTYIESRTRSQVCESLDNTSNSRRQGAGQHGSRPSLLAARPQQPGTISDAAENAGSQSAGRRLQRPAESSETSVVGSSDQSQRSGTSFWSACDWLSCIDGKARPVEPGTFPLAHGAANRVGRLRGYGNSLVAPVAQAFIEAYLEVLNGG